MDFLRKTFLFSILIAFSFLSAVASAQGLGTNSEGFRMGQLTKFSIKGLINKSGEGEMLVGNESTPYVKTFSCGDQVCKETLNPWDFSVDPNNSVLIKQLNDLSGEYVVLQYHQAIVRNAVSYNTSYMVVGAWPVSQSLNPATCTAKNMEAGSRSSGFRVGRVVKVSNKGKLVKSWEAIVQVGNSGSQFIKMSIEDETMANCALVYLRSGKKVKVNYEQSIIRNPLESDTNYEITKIEATKNGLE